MGGGPGGGDSGALTGAQIGAMAGSAVPGLGTLAGLALGAVVGHGVSGGFGDFGSSAVGDTPTVGGSLGEGADFGTGGMHGPPGVAPSSGGGDVGPNGPADRWQGGQPRWLKEKFREPDIDLDPLQAPSPYVDPQADLTEIDTMNKLAADRNLRFAPGRGEESATRSLDLLSERDQLVGARGPDMFKRTQRSALARREGVPVSYAGSL